MKDIYTHWVVYVASALLEQTTPISLQAEQMIILIMSRILILIVLNIHNSNNCNNTYPCRSATRTRACRASTSRTRTWISTSSAARSPGPSPSPRWGSSRTTPCTSPGPPTARAARRSAPSSPWMATNSWTSSPTRQGQTTTSS